MAIRVPAPPLSRLRPGLRPAGPARPVIGLQGRRAGRAAARGRHAAPGQSAAPAGLADRAVLAALIRILPGRLRAHLLVTPGYRPALAASPDRPQADLSAPGR